MHNIVYDIRHYFSFAAVLDTSIGVCFSSFVHKLDNKFPALKQIQYVSHIPFVFWTLTKCAVIGMALCGEKKLLSEELEVK